MKIMNVQEFKQDQYRNYRERRTSQFTRFLDKSVDFVTYYNINKVVSTSSINNHEVDSYIGEDSPIRYNKINNFPIYGFPIIDSTNSYEEEAGGHTGIVEGNIIILQEILEPLEGDCFVLNMFTDRYFFRITEVSQTIIKSKPYYNVAFISSVPEYLPQLEKQVVEEYNALFDNIGTQDKVIISKNEYSLAAQYFDIYSAISDYYISKFYNGKIGIIGINLPMSVTGTQSNYTDKFLIKFMEENRVILFDNVLKNSFCLDFNNLPKKDDFLTYKKTLYWAITNKNISKYSPGRYISVSAINSPFTLLRGQSDTTFYVSNDIYEDEPEVNKFYFDYNFEEFKSKYMRNDIFNTTTPHDRVMSIFINFMKGTILMPGHFNDLIGELDDFEEYMYLPLILYIIRCNMEGLTNSKITI